MEQAISIVLFYSFSAAAVVSALFVVIKKNPVTCAMNLVVTFFSISGIYILLNSQFIAIMQILVYTGAIMVLILFVIMLLNLRPADIILNNRTVSKGAIVIFLSIAMGILLATVIYYGDTSGTAGGITPGIISESGSTQIIARAMFSQYLLPFELVSVLITIAIIGAVVLSHGGASGNRREEE